MRANHAPQASYEEKLDSIRREAARWAELETSGRLGHDDRAEFQGWLAASPAHELEFEMMRHLLESEELCAALSVEAETHLHAGRRRGRRRPFLALPLSWPILASLGAAAIVMLAAVPVALNVLDRPTAPSSSSAPAASVTAHYETANGEYFSTRLEDGTQLELNGGTRVDIRLTERGRYVTLLSGDVSFDIAKDPTRPFRVQTEHGQVTAVGTAFTVSHFDHRTAIAVTEGRIRVDTTAGLQMPTYYNAGKRVSVDASGELDVSDFIPDDGMDWQTGWVDTPSITVGDLAALVERRTGVDIVVDDEAAALEVSGRFRIDEPATVFRRVGLIHHVAIRQTQDRIDVTAAGD